MEEIMYAKQTIKIILSTLIVVVSLNTNIFANEDIHYNPNCRACPVNLRIAADAAHKTIGKEGVKMMRQLKEIGRKTIKIDMDGKLKNGTEKDPNTDYEILIIGSSIKINMNSLMDTSNIVVYTDIQNIPKDTDYSNWWPQIHLRPFEKIKKYETTDTAWEKMQRSHVYTWVSPEKNIEKWKIELGKKISQVLELVLEKNTTVK